MNRMIYGFAFTSDLTMMNFKEINSSLIEKGADLNDVVFSTWDDVDSDCTWILAANEYIEDADVCNFINFVIENNLEDDFALIDYLHKK